MNEMRRIHRSDGAGNSSHSSSGAGAGSGRRMVNTTHSRQESAHAQPSGSSRPSREPEHSQNGRGPKKPKKGHPILRGVLRIIATLFCLGIMAGCALTVCLVFYVVQATADDGDLLDLDSIELSQSSVVVATDPDTGTQIEYATLRSSNSHRMWVDLEQIPTYLQYAFICTEDKDF